MIFIRKLVAWPLCLLLGFGLYVSSSSQVLCLGDSGHVKIETVHLNTCCDTECSTPAPEREDSDHNCAGCSDIPLDSPRLWQRFRGTDGPIMATAALHQAISSDDQGSISDRCSSHARTIVAGEKPAVPMATTVTVLLC